MLIPVADPPRRFFLILLNKIVLLVCEIDHNDTRDYGEMC
jgi:hypothetical protein